MKNKAQDNIRQIEQKFAVTIKYIRVISEVSSYAVDDLYGADVLCDN
jgi:hypothetical protein